METIIKKLKNPAVLLATAANIWVILETVDVLNFCGTTESNYMKVVGAVIAILIQVGIMTQPEKPINIDEISNKNNTNY